LTAAVVVLVSEAAKRIDRLGALVAALPLVTVLTLIWLRAEKQPETKIANYAWYTFWYVLPTLPMFLLFPWLGSSTGSASGSHSSHASGSRRCGSRAWRPRCAASESTPGCEH